MINLEPAIEQIKRLLEENTARSVTYAALEARLAIERICYERLRQAHDYISHDDLRKWQPSEIVKTLIQDVDRNAAQTLTLSIAKGTAPDTSKPPSREEYEKMDWLPLGTQIGFNPNKLGKLWNGLAKLALHIEVPVSKDTEVAQYGDVQAIHAKVSQALEEIVRISEGNLLISPGLGEQVSFKCKCGSVNKRKLAPLNDGQVISCVNPDCDESYAYVAEDISFARRSFEITCRACGAIRYIPKKMVEKLRTDQHVHFDCEGCSETIYVSWRLMQGQRKRPVVTA